MLFRSIKVEKFNEKYRLREQGAVLNWFDITAPEGRLSLNDKVEEILKTAEGRELFSRLTSKLKGKSEGLPSGEEAFKMLGGFTLLRLLTMLKMMDIEFSKEELLKINSHLNEIKKS